MSVRVRFAPSPTGHLHIGGARTALYCYLYAKRLGGQYLLRIEDTDLERSTREYELKMIEELKWLGLNHDEGPDVGGSVAPYRQSERLDLYKQKAWELIEKGVAYPCFLTETELEELTKKAEADKLAPHTFHGKYRDYPLADAKARIAKGEGHVIRFKNPQKTYTFIDKVRGEVSFPPDMVGDFVIIRSNQMPVYNFCCVIDDWTMKISHVIRAEEHLPNTLRQLILYEAFGATPPQFAHCSLLVGEDRQKLSKRHGATSVAQYREMRYLPEALLNYLCLLGWSHPDEKDIFTLDEIVPLFDLERFIKSPALYDIQKLNYFNAEHLKRKPVADLVAMASETIAKEHPFHAQSDEWKETCLKFFVQKIQLIGELESQIAVLFKTETEASAEMNEIEGWETTSQMRNYLKEEVAKLGDNAFADAALFAAWGDHIKGELKIKGKPLFKGMRAVLTGQAEGPDLKDIIPLTPASVLKKRLGA